MHYAPHPRKRPQCLNLTLFNTRCNRTLTLFKITVYSSVKMTTAYSPAVLSNNVSLA